MQLRPVELDRPTNLVVLTGAGISAGSGLPTFRGTGSVAGRDPTQTLDVSRLPEGLDEIWAWIDEIRAAVATAEPNAAHRALAAAEKRHSGTFTLATSNVDGLHQRAGSSRVFELHGSAWRARCMDPECPAEPFADHALLLGDEAAAGVRRPCPVCGGPTRPDATLYGERQQALAEWETKRALRDVDVFVAIGTSGVVQPAASYGRWAQENGARCILVNLEEHADPAPWFAETHLGRAEDVVPLLFPT